MLVILVLHWITPPFTLIVTMVILLVIIVIIDQPARGWRACGDHHISKLAERVYQSFCDNKFVFAHFCNKNFVFADFCDNYFIFAHFRQKNCICTFLWQKFVFTHLFNKNFVFAHFCGKKLYLHIFATKILYLHIFARKKIVFAHFHFILEQRWRASVELCAKVFTMILFTIYNDAAGWYLCWAVLPATNQPGGLKLSSVEKFKDAEQCILGQSRPVNHLQLLHTFWQNQQLDRSHSDFPYLPLFPHLYFNLSSKIIIFVKTTNFLMASDAK